MVSAVGVYKSFINDIHYMKPEKMLLPLLILGVVEVWDVCNGFQCRAEVSHKALFIIRMILKAACKMEICNNITIQPITVVTAHWLEKEAVAGFRIWQLMFLCFAGILTLVIILCCCIRFRIPRTKQEIEADYIRKKITKKFQKQLRMIRNADMDDMDLKRALDRIRAEFKSDTESLAQSDALSGATLSSCNYRLPGDLAENYNNCSETYRKASDIGISFEDIMKRERKGIMQKFPTFVGRIAKLHAFRKQPDAPE